MDHAKVVNHTLTSDGYVHKFGIDNNQGVANVTLAELLLITSSKGLIFKIAEKGKGTYQNFQCYSGKPPTILRADEARVRCALTLLYKHIDDDRKALLWKKQPLDDVPSWNQERNKVADAIQKEVIDALFTEEKAMADKLNVKHPKRSASTISTVMGRYDKLSQDKRKLSNKKLK